METCIDISAKAHGGDEPDEGSGLSAVPSQTAIPVPHGLQRKLDNLVNLLLSYKSMAIGFSGGVDSTFLATVCARFLPADRVTLIHLDTPLIGTPERASFARERERFARMGLQTICLTENPLEHASVTANPADRCYHCKRAAFSSVVTEARRRGLAVVLEGSNADDAGDYRPGMHAVRELGVQSPLMETGWHKSEEREVLKLWGHEVWSLPAGACLATRIPCGETLTQKKLKVVRACEDYLHELGLAQVRVRLDNGTARVSTDSAGLNVLQRLSTKEADVEGATRGVAAGKGNDAEVCTGAVGERADDGCDGTTNERADGERDGATGSEPTSSSIAACSNGVLHTNDPCAPLPRQVMDALLANGATAVDLTARLYLHGETSVVLP
ncbi:hypothetical protein [Collinsella stercoris]|uniref:ATP-dependent sacrificial sulfur transferase LarE n=1 Tax=Collinsella stercoris TaxID=147206 RepID=UPI003AF0A1A1